MKPSWALLAPALGLLALAAGRAEAAGSAAPDALEALRARGVLAWAADEEGGGPYVYPREDDPEQVTGFEVELAAALARELGVAPRFTQGPWDKLLDLLHARKADVVLNGYEWTPARAEAFDATIPYYVYRLQLLARQADASVGSVDDLARPAAGGRLRRVGVLTGSAAETWARGHLAGGCEIVTYDGNTDAMREVETGKLDATLQDTPIVRFYGPRFPALRAVGGPVAPGHYVLYLRQGQETLRRALDDALITLWRTGELRRILERHGLWDDAQQELGRIVDAGRFYGQRAALGAGNGPVLTARASGTPPGGGEGEAVAETAARGWAAVGRYGGTLLRAAGMTVLLSVLSFPLAIGLGLVVALGRRYGPGWVRQPLGLYVELLRGTPLMLQLYFLFFLLPEVGVVLPALATAVLGLAVNYSAYEAEIYRAGLQAVPPGQLEAALSLGMTRALAVRRIVVPQAVRLVIPPAVNDFIALFKDTSVCSVVTVVELTKRYSVMAMSTQAVLELMAMTCVLYLLMSYPLSLLSRRIEARLAGAEARA